MINSIANGTTFLYCLPKNYTHTFDVGQDSSLQIDVAFKCLADCSTVGYTQLMVTPIIYNRLINPQDTNYMEGYLEKRKYYIIDTQSYQFDTVLDYTISKY